ESLLDERQLLSDAPQIRPLAVELLAERRRNQQFFEGKWLSLANEGDFVLFVFGPQLGTHRGGRLFFLSREVEVNSREIRGKMPEVGVRPHIERMLVTLRALQPHSQKRVRKGHRGVGGLV